MNGGRESPGRVLREDVVTVVSVVVCTLQSGWVGLLMTCFGRIVCSMFRKKKAKPTHATVAPCGTGKILFFPDLILIVSCMQVPAFIHSMGTVDGTWEATWVGEGLDAGWRRVVEADAR